MSDIPVSVVVPTRQRRESVRRLLTALSRQTIPPSEFEVIVSINGPDDGTSGMVGAFAGAFPLRSVWQSAPGRGAACNAGVRAARGEVIVLLDDDMEPLEGCLHGHLEAHASGKALGVVGAAPMVVEDSSPPIVAYRARGFRRKLDALRGMNGALPFNKVYTGNFSIRRQVFLDAGGYDEEFRMYGHEDYELALRLSRAGVEFVYSESAAALQHYDKDLAGLADNTIAEGRTALLFARKHPEVLAALPLGRFNQMSLRSRALRDVLLFASRHYGRLPSILVRTVAGFEKRRSPRLPAFYDTLFDHLYWLGAEQQARESSATGGPRSLSEELARLEAIARNEARP